MSSMQSAHIPWEVEPHEYRLTPILEVTPEQEQRLKRNLSFALSRGEEAEFLAYREQVAAEVFDILEGYRDHIDPAIYESLHADLVTELLPLDNQAVKRVQLIKRTLEKTLGMWTGEMTSVDRENAMQTAYSAIRTERSAKVRVRAVDTMIGYAIAEYFLRNTNENEHEAQTLIFAFTGREDVHTLVRELKMTALKTPEKIDSVMTIAFQTLSVLLKTPTEFETLPSEDAIREQRHAALGSPEEFLGELTDDEVAVDGKLLAFKLVPMEDIEKLCAIYNASVTAVLTEQGYADTYGKPLIVESESIRLEACYLTHHRFTSPDGYRRSVIEAAKDYLCARWFDEKSLTWAHVATH